MEKSEAAQWDSGREEGGGRGMGRLIRGMMVSSFTSCSVGVRGQGECQQCLTTMVRESPGRDHPGKPLGLLIKTASKAHTPHFTSEVCDIKYLPFISN